MDYTPKIPNVQGKTLSWLLQEPPEVKMTKLFFSGIFSGWKSNCEYLGV